MKQKSNRNYNSHSKKNSLQKKSEVMMIHAETSVKHIKYSSLDFRPRSGFVMNAGWRSTDKRYFQKRTVVFDGEMQMDTSR